MMMSILSVVSSPYAWLLLLVWKPWKRQTSRVTGLRRSDVCSQSIVLHDAKHEKKCYLCKVTELIFVLKVCANEEFCRCQLLSLPAFYLLECTLYGRRPVFRKINLNKIRKMILVGGLKEKDYTCIKERRKRDQEISRESLRTEWKWKCPPSCAPQLPQANIMTYKR